MGQSSLPPPPFRPLPLSLSLSLVLNSKLAVGRILLKNLKRVIVSTTGGLQLIADLNAYHTFITSLRQPQVTAYFTSLKMVGEIFIVEDPKDLGALVRDTSRYEGTLSPDDLYELGK
jgi:recyclin-1